MVRIHIHAGPALARAFAQGMFFLVVFTYTRDACAGARANTASTGRQHGLSPTRGLRAREVRTFTGEPHRVSPTGALGVSV
jgi:hypothetical protein